MGKFFGGFALAAVLALGTWYGVLLPSGDADCNGRCGEGTVCEVGACRPELDEPSGEEEVEAEAKPKKRRRRRRNRRGRGDAGGDAEAPQGGGAPPIADDSSVPRFNPRATKTIDAQTGSERLSDATIDRELRKLDPAFQRCINDAAKRTDAELPSGRVKYEFGIDPSGKVNGVNVSGSSALRELGVMPCVRIAIHRHRFPSFDGTAMGASGSFSI